MKGFIFVRAEKPQVASIEACEKSTKMWMNYYRSSWLASWFRVTRATDMLKAFHRLPPDAQEKDWTGLNTGVSPLSCTGRHEMIFSHVVCSSGPLTGSKSYVAEEKVRTTNPLNPTVFMGW